MQKKRTDNFSKFANKKKGSAIKESIRQEKKKIKAEARVAGEEFRKKKLDKMRGVSEEKGIKSKSQQLKVKKKSPNQLPAVSMLTISNQQSAISKPTSQQAASGKRQAASNKQASSKQPSART